MKLSAIVILAKAATYHEDNKKKFKRAAMKWLKELSERLQLSEGSYDIRYNEGGVAVSGEATLHHESVYIQISESGCFWRTCKGRRDFQGGSNNWVEGFGHSMSMQQVVNILIRHLPLSNAT